MRDGKTGAKDNSQKEPARKMKIPLAFRRLLIYNNRAVTRRGENGFQPIQVHMLLWLSW